MIGFLLYKIYTKVFSKNDGTPWNRTFIYVSLNMVFLVFSVYLIVEGFLSFFAVDLSFAGSIPNWLKNSFLFGVIPVTLSYFLFFYKKNIEYYEQKYKNHWLNKLYVDGLLFIFPFILFFIGPILRILLFGGYMLGNDYVGYLKG